MNLDRTPRNPNLLRWHRRTWLIDHGAALYPQHSDAGLAASARDPFRLIAQHVLLPYAGSIADADARLADRAAGAFGDAIAEVPREWLARDADADAPADADARAGEIERFFGERLADRTAWLEEAERARP
jgi:hypothetical protein